VHANPRQLDEPSAAARSLRASLTTRSRRIDAKGRLLFETSSRSLVLFEHDLFERPVTPLFGSCSSVHSRNRSQGFVVIRVQADIERKVYQPELSSFVDAEQNDLSPARPARI
jgi:hypothetical protein